MKRRLGLLVAALLPGLLIMLGSGIAGASALKHHNFTGIAIVNNGNSLSVSYHGNGNPLTVSMSPSTMTQFNCGSYFVAGNWHTACQWKNAGGLCMDANESTGIVYAENCVTGQHPELWITDSGPGGSQLYFFQNVYWSQQGNGLEYLTEENQNDNSQIGANFGGGFGNAAVWIL